MTDAMVNFVSEMTEDQARSFLENLASADDRAVVKHTVGNCVIKVPAGLINQRVFKSMADTMVTITWTKGTKRFVIRAPEAVVDEANEMLRLLAVNYVAWLKDGKVSPPPSGSETAAGTFARPLARDETWVQAPHVPGDVRYRTAVSDIACYVRESDLHDYPDWCDKLLKFLVEEMGADLDSSAEEDYEMGKRSAASMGGRTHAKAMPQQGRKQ